MTSAPIFISKAEPRAVPADAVVIAVTAAAAGAGAPPHRRRRLN